MRDDRHLWTPPKPLWNPLAFKDANLCAVTLTRQSLISGTNVRKADLPLIEWPDVAKDATYRLSLRRDRVAEINGDIRPEGWNATKGEACSDVSDGYTVLQLKGRAALGILKRGTEISLEHPSASVARKLFGLDVWLYRFGVEDQFRIHVARAYDETLIAHLTTAAQHR